MKDFKLQITRMRFFLFGDKTRSTSKKQKKDRAFEDEILNLYGSVNAMTY